MTLTLVLMFAPLASCRLCDPENGLAKPGFRTSRDYSCHCCGSTMRHTFVERDDRERGIFRALLEHASFGSRNHIVYPRLRAMLKQME